MKVKALNRLTVRTFQRHSASTFHHFDTPTIAITNRQRARRINLLRLKQMTGALLADLGIERGEIGVYLVGTLEMSHLNETQLQHAGSTDVIAFDYSACGGAGCPQPASKPAAIGASHPTLHGEICICVQEAVRQARRFHTTWQSEVVRYLVHGTLHLLGYDDSRLKARRKMKHEEDRRLRRLSRRFSLAELGRTAKLPRCKNR
jgi:probable rRNA maturation factor